VLPWTAQRPRTLARDLPTHSFDAGALVVRPGQRLGNLVVYLLEPESDDGLARWEFFDAQHFLVEPLNGHRTRNPGDDNTGVSTERILNEIGEPLVGCDEHRPPSSGMSQDVLIGMTGEADVADVLRDEARLPEEPGERAGHVFVDEIPRH
jgi:hypothetical protein